MTDLFEHFAPEQPAVAEQEPLQENMLPRLAGDWDEPFKCVLQSYENRGLSSDLAERLVRTEWERYCRDGHPEYRLEIYRRTKSESEKPCSGTRRHG